MANEPTPGQAASEGITENPAAPAPVATSENITATPPAPLPAPAPVVAAPAAQARPWVPPAWLPKADYVILAMLLLLTFFLGSFTAVNSDVWMHLAIGQRISAGEFSFGADPFSWLTEATPAPVWVHQSWLYSFLFFQLHELVGGVGLVFIKALVCTIAVGLLSRVGWTEASRWFVLITLVTAALAVSPRLLLQPVVVSFLFLSITLFVLDRVGFFGHARSDGKAPCPRSLWALPPLFALWANLDAWFILGPIVLGLCWAGAGLTRWFPNAKVVPARTLGLVFGASVLACVVNPYHVRVFQLPPELGYLVVAVTDAVHLRLPNEVVGAGRTLSELRKGDSDLAWTMSSLSPKYWYEPRAGLNIAGIAFYPLVLLGLLGFTLTALMKPRPGAPTFHVGRFVLWLVFGVMALALYRMIPFFVLIAAPLTAMTLGEFLNWQQTVSATPAEKRNRGLKLARIVSIPFVLLLLFLAWPGWLGVKAGQGSTDYASPRRVAWDIRAEPSLQRTAETLHALKEKGECQNVFNSMSFDLADYLAWFAPEVKFGMDSRFALYAERAPGYINARKSLLSQQSAEWEDYFVAHKVDQVVVVNFVKRDGSFPVRWWLDVDQWRQRDGDNRAVAFSWVGRDKRWPADDDDAWDREAFGPVPKERRPPADGTPMPEPPGSLALYLDGIGPQPIGVPECRLLKKRFDAFGEIRGKGRHVGVFWMYASLTSVQAMPLGGLNICPAFIVTERWTNQPPRDIGPPALPILMMRSARKAVADNPLDAQSRLCLIEAVQARHHQEDYWVGAYGNRPSQLRERMRQIQLCTNLYALTQLPPDNPESYLRLAESHRLLAGLYFNQEKMYDMALEQMQAAEKAMEAYRPANTQDQKRIESNLKQLREEVKNLDKLVRQRVSKWKELPSNLSPFQKAGWAYHGEFEELQGNRPVKVRYGLGKKALDILLEIKSETLPDDQRLLDAQLRFDLLLATGHADTVMESLKRENVRKSLPSVIFARNQLFAGAALGDYDAMEEALAAMEKNAQEDLIKANELARGRVGTFAPMFLVMPQIGSASALAGAATFQAFVPLGKTNEMYQLLNFQHNELSNAITLRGIVALEAGNTEHARVLFKRAIDDTSDIYYITERPIARRYLELLNEQKR